LEDKKNCQVMISLNMAVETLAISEGKRA
jgi:hypothetical protein